MGEKSALFCRQILLTTLFLFGPEMEAQGGFVRKNIALKLRDQGPTSFAKVDSPPPGKREEGELGSSKAGLARIIMHLLCLQRMFLVKWTPPFTSIKSTNGTTPFIFVGVPLKTLFCISVKSAPCLCSSMAAW